MGKFKGIIFDMDGTLTLPSIDFTSMREELGVPDNEDILNFVLRKESEEKESLLKIIERHESDGRKNIKFQKGSRELIKSLKDEHIKIAILTRNSFQSASIVLDAFNIDFDEIVTREFGHVKPSPEPLNYISEKWKIDKDLLLMVGDHVDDIACGKNAGVKTCYFNSSNITIKILPDFEVSSFFELGNIING